MVPPDINEPEVNYRRGSRLTFSDAKAFRPSLLPTKSAMQSSGQELAHDGTDRFLNCR
jgi:hypothetical protein